MHLHSLNEGERGRAGEAQLPPSDAGKGGHKVPSVGRDWHTGRARRKPKAPSPSERRVSSARSNLCQTKHDIILHRAPAAPARHLHPQYVTPSRCAPRPPGAKLRGRRGEENLTEAPGKGRSKGSGFI